MNKIGANDLVKVVIKYSNKSCDELLQCSAQIFCPFCEQIIQILYFAEELLWDVSKFDAHVKTHIGNFEFEVIENNCEYGVILKTLDIT